MAETNTWFLGTGSGFFAEFKVLLTGLTAGLGTALGVSVDLLLSDDLLTEAAGELNGPVLGFVEADFTDGEVDFSVDICCTGGSRRDCSFDDNFLGAGTLDDFPLANVFDETFL